MPYSGSVGVQHGSGGSFGFYGPSMGSGYIGSGGHGNRGMVGVGPVKPGGKSRPPTHEAQGGGQQAGNQGGAYHAKGG